MIGATVLILVGIILFSGKSESSPSDSTSQPPPVAKEDLILAENYAKGNKDAKTTIVEFSDFQCPACKSAEPTLRKLLSIYGDKVYFVYRHFPLDSHPNATPAARAAEAAGKQEKFWEMHDKIFDNQKEWEFSKKPDEIFRRYAEDFKLDMAKYDADVKSDELKQKVKTDRLTGDSLGITATPTFYINGKKTAGVVSFEEFQKEIEKNN